MRTVVLALISAVVASGCSGKTEDDTTGSTGGTAGVAGPGGGGAGGGGTGGGGTGGGTSMSCPSSPPMTGDSCTLTGAGTGFVRAQCSWGDDPRPECRTSGLCQQDGTWLITPPDTTVCTTPALPPECPASPATVGTECADPTLSCWYADGTNCFCSECSGGSEYPICQPISPAQWACRTRPSGCPSDIPQAGTSCDQEGASCGPDCELEVVCQNGKWVWNTGNCPICAAPDTLIATPQGERPIADLRVGDLVYSVDRNAFVAVPILRTGSTPVAHHHVMRIELRNGRVLEMSPGHPTADGRLFADLAKGNLLDVENEVTAATLVPYARDRTYDILPDSSTGTYVAAGALVGSTLFDGTNSRSGIGETKHRRRGKLLSE